MLLFKFSYGEKFLKLVQFLFSFVMYYYLNLEQWQKKIETGSKNIKPRIHVNHNIYIQVIQHF